MQGGSCCTLPARLALADWAPRMLAERRTHRHKAGRTHNANMASCTLVTAVPMPMIVAACTSAAARCMAARLQPNSTTQITLAAMV